MRKSWIDLLNEISPALWDPPEFEELSDLMLRSIPPNWNIDLSSDTLWMLPACIDRWNWDEMEWSEMLRWIRSWVQEELEWRGMKKGGKNRLLLLLLLFLALEFKLNGYESFYMELNELMGVFRNDDLMWSWYLELIINFNCFRFTNSYLDEITSILKDRSLFLQEFVLGYFSVCNKHFKEFTQCAKAWNQQCRTHNKPSSQPRKATAKYLPCSL